MHRKFLPGTRIYACGNCHAHLTNHDDIVSKSFQGRTGRAYLFNTVPTSFLHLRKYPEMRFGSIALVPS